MAAPGHAQRGPGRWLSVKGDDGGDTGSLPAAGEPEAGPQARHANPAEGSGRPARSGVDAAAGSRPGPEQLPPAWSPGRGTQAPAAVGGTTVSATVNVVAADAPLGAKGSPLAPSVASSQRPQAGHSPSLRPARLKAEDIDAAHAALLRYTIKQEASLQLRLDSAAQRTRRLRQEAAGASGMGAAGLTSRLGGGGGGGSSLGGFPASVLHPSGSQTGPAAPRHDDDGSTCCASWGPTRARLQLVRGGLSCGAADRCMHEPAAVGAGGRRVARHRILPTAASGSGRSTQPASDSPLIVVAAVPACLPDGLFAPRHPCAAPDAVP